MSAERYLAVDLVDGQRLGPFAVTSEKAARACARRELEAKRLPKGAAVVEVDAPAANGDPGYEGPFEITEHHEHLHTSDSLRLMREGDLEAAKAAMDRRTLFAIVDAKGRKKATRTSRETAEQLIAKWNGEDGDSSSNGKPSLPAEAVEASKELAELLEQPDAPPDIGVGLHPDVPMETYLAIDAASNTALGWLKRSPAHLKAYIDEPPTFVDPESIGRALHALVLEGFEAFEARYSAGPVDDKRLKAWKEWEKELEDGLCAMRPSHYQQVQDMAERILDHPAARHALDGVTLTEMTGVWIDPETGIRCKLRADAINPTLGTSIDLKSTVDAQEDAFERSVWNYGYHRQGALYHRGLNVLLPAMEWNHHVILAQEKEAPFAVQVFRIENETLAQGDREIGNLLPRYARCLESNYWPGYSEDYVTVSLPRWAWTQIEAEFEAEAHY